MLLRPMYVLLLQENVPDVPRLGDDSRMAQAVALDVPVPEMDPRILAKFVNGGSERRSES